jgi:hypothetical protein
MNESMNQFQFGFKIIQNKAFEASTKTARWKSFFNVVDLQILPCISCTFPRPIDFLLVMHHIAEAIAML